MGMGPGSLCIGNSVFSIGMIGGLSSGLRILAGGEIVPITQMVSEGRERALERMLIESKASGGIGLTGVSSELIRHAGNIEFLSVASAVQRLENSNETTHFSTSASAQELYCQVDAGFNPVSYVFGNVAYSIGVGGGIGGFFRGLSRGEVTEYTRIFDITRHLALTRLTDQAKKAGANSVIGIKTSIIPFMGAQEMLMEGTASNHPALSNFASRPVTSDMTNEELWNMVNIGYLPIQLVMGVSVYSLGLIGNIKSAFLSLARGELNDLTQLIYEAREKALERIELDAERCGADEVVGVKTYVYDLGGGLVEFLAIGTAVKKVEGITTRHQVLPPQAIIQDRDTFYGAEPFDHAFSTSDRTFMSARRTLGLPLMLVPLFFMLMMLAIRFFSVFR